MNTCTSSYCLSDVLPVISKLNLWYVSYPKT